MVKTIAFLLCMLSGLSLLAQQNLGIQNSNYAGIQGALLNPSSIADSKLKWDVNILSWDVSFANNFLVAPKSSLNFLGFKRIIKGSIDENLFTTHFDPQNPNKLYNLTFSTEVLGPSFFIKVKKKYEIGFTMAARASTDIRDISGNMAQNAFDYLLSPGLWNTDLHDYTARLNAMGWLEYGLHYAMVIRDDGRNELKAGISLNYLQGIAAAYFKNTHINYNIQDTANIAFTNTSIDYGRTDIDDYRHDHSYHNLNHGHGFGADLGLTWVHRLDDAGFSNQTNGQPDKTDKINYLYKIGLSLIDLGSIGFNRNTASYHLQADNADFTNWHQSKFSGNTQLDQTLSAVFYNGDSSKSLTNTHFNMALPAALSVQADYNFGRNLFANATIIKGFGHGDHNGVTRPDVYSITPRYETKWWEVSIPLSVINYHHSQARAGVAVRYRYFFIGGDAPGSLLKLNDLQGVDFYAGVHYFIPEKSGSH
jgi:Family of unknown function (DUF5723)